MSTLKRNEIEKRIQQLSLEADEDLLSQKKLERKLDMKKLDDMVLEIDEFVQMVLRHRTTEMKGKTLLELFPVQERMPARLQKIAEAARVNRTEFNNLSPTLLFAVLGQAKFDLKIDAITESKVLSQQLRRWAFLRK